jgi:hypothetical protein
VSLQVGVWVRGYNSSSYKPSSYEMLHRKMVMNLEVPKKYGEFLNQLSDCQLLKKESAPWS